MILYQIALNESAKPLFFDKSNSLADLSLTSSMSGSCSEIAHRQTRCICLKCPFPSSAGYIAHVFASSAASSMWLCLMRCFTLIASKTGPSSVRNSETESKRLSSLSIAVVYKLYHLGTYYFPSGPILILWGNTTKIFLFRRLLKYKPTVFCSAYLTLQGFGHAIEA